MTDSRVRSFPHPSMRIHDSLKSASTYLNLEGNYGARNYQTLPVVLSRGKGAWLWDVEGKKYLDMMSAYSAVSCGHAHPRIVEAAYDQMQKLAVCSRAYHSDPMGPLLEKLCGLCRLDQALPMNSGAEAVETSLKAARRWGYEVKKIPDGCAEIITMEGNFHGRTLGVISFSTEPSYRRHFGPFLPGFKTVPFGDLRALEASITPNTCAILVEPIQGEAGILVPPQGWMKGVEEICRRHNVLFIADEVQSGLGRTGTFLACEHDDIRPDMVLLGKALGGGLLPVSMIVGTHAVMDVFTPGSHGSTFGGNPLAMRVAYEVLCVLEEENLIARSATLGAFLSQELQKLSSPLIRDIRGRGLWMAVDLDPRRVSARRVCEDLMTRGILTKETHETVVRLAPSFVITEEEISFAVKQIALSLENF